MKKKIMRAISYILTLLFLLSAITACADSPDDVTDPPESTEAAINSGNSSESATGEATSDIDPFESATEEITTDGEPDASSDVLPAESETEGEPEVNEPIMADLNNDGIDDQILIVFEDAKKSAATVKVINGKDSSELMSERLSLTAGKKGAFYLKIGKNGNYNELVFWNYNGNSAGGMDFRYGVFRFDEEGKRSYSVREDKRFDLGAKINSENVVFLTMRKTINDHIVPHWNSHDSYLLLDNQGEKLQYSTVDAMLVPEELTCTLQNLADKIEVQ